jgi:hypothetical protein
MQLAPVRVECIILEEIAQTAIPPWVAIGSSRGPLTWTETQRISPR